jgi:hypothetical protein
VELVLGFVPKAALNIEKKELFVSTMKQTHQETVLQPNPQISCMLNIPELTCNDLRNNSEEGYKLNSEKL